MAELPDLTVFAGILNRRFKGKTLKNLTVSVEKKINVSAKRLSETLEGKKLVEVSREGKTLQLHFSADQILGLHLMLRGELVLIEEEKERPKFEILGFHFSGGTGFSVVDMQKMATPTLNPAPAEAPDALSISLDEFLALMAKKRSVVKTVFMDQHLIRGIGNSYADEILWHAKISPFSVAKAIPEKEVKMLFKSMVSVLETAIKEIAEENGDELRGELRDFMKVHSAKLKKSPTGAAIKADKIGGRVTYYTDEQKLFN